ncbi:thiamine pyrophosphate-dependent enzyme, partial [Arthrobacter sp. GCM10027362]|uniref:thiamine pyrophosphate-dependent enzyme n=1 Tax=Arthrobacter sp. GCM10027362 TaxID=3273379 RepID=UPI00362C1240
SGAIAARAELEALADRVGALLTTSAVGLGTFAGSQRADVAFEPVHGGGTIDPRTLTPALNDLLPIERVVVPDGGNFSGYAAMFFQVPDARGYCLPLAFQSIGLALSCAIGTAVANPDRMAVAGVGDGGLMMSLTELDTAVRDWLAGDRSTPLVIDAKISSFPSWVLAHTFTEE